MARGPGAEAIYEVAAQFRQRCLIDGKSLLWPQNDAWTVDNITELRQSLEKRIDVAGGFYTMLPAQIDDCSSDVHKVAADVIALYQLPISSPNQPAAKKNRIREVLGWKLASDKPDLELLDRAYSDEVDYVAYKHAGLMHPGQYYLQQIPWQIAFYLDFAREALSQNANVMDTEVCKSIAAGVQQEKIWDTSGNCSAARHILMHLLFPDEFERMSSETHKQAIRATFADLAAGAEDVDEAILNIRRALEKQSPGRLVDFYAREDIRAQWDPLGAISDLLKDRRLDDPESLTDSGLRENIRPITRPFLGRVNGELGLDSAKFFAGGNAAKKRASFDSIHAVLPNPTGEWNYDGATAFVSVGYQDAPGSDPDLERCLVWGVQGYPKAMHCSGGKSASRRSFRTGTT